MRSPRSGRRKNLDKVGLKPCRGSGVGSKTVDDQINSTFEPSMSEANPSIVIVGKNMTAAFLDGRSASREICPLRAKILQSVGTSSYGSILLSKTPSPASSACNRVGMFHSRPQWWFRKDAKKVGKFASLAPYLWGGRLYYRRSRSVKLGAQKKTPTRRGRNLAGARMSARRPSTLKSIRYSPLAPTG